MSLSALQSAAVRALLGVGLLAPQAAAFAQSTADLTQISIEDLMKIEVTTASRKEQPAGDTAAAVFVITQEDIRRSGMRSIPDLLRLAPGVHVAQVNANKWAVTVRGFNDLYANKLVVMVDGRSVYNRLFSGVIWFEQDLMIDDIDRIEVIRGPGGTMWGANAVNGVINIVTRTAGESQGGLVRVDVGSAGEQAAMRYGGAHGSLAYRVFAQATGSEATLLEPGAPANDRSGSATAGFRADWSTGVGVFALKGGVTGARNHGLWVNLDPATAAQEPLSNDRTDAQGAYAFGQWTHTRPSSASLQVQATLDAANRDEPIGDYARRLLDVDTQYRFAGLRRHDLLIGAGYRVMSEDFDGHTGASLTPAHDHSSLFTAFVQDDLDFLDDRLTVTLGGQVQYDSDWGAGVQPTARAVWKMRSGQRLWTAWSRARRTPSLIERGIRLDYPVAPAAAGLPTALTVIGSTDARTERVSDLEVGYRVGLGGVASLDVTAYAGRYTNLTSRELQEVVFEPRPSPRLHLTAQLGNEMEASVRGVEVAGTWTPVPAWRLDGSYTAFDFSPRPDPASQDPTAATRDGNAPRSQGQVRSVVTLRDRTTASAALFAVGPLRDLGVDGYLRADLTLEYRLTRSFSVMAFGQNLLDGAHREFDPPQALTLATQVPRSAGVRLRWISR